MNYLKKKNDIDKVKYLSHFVVRAFLIAVFIIFGISALLFSSYFVDLMINSKSGKLKKPLFGTYVIVSPSMVPTINVNDGIFVKRVDNDNYNIGDIITFASSDSRFKNLTITHRVVEKEKSYNNSSFYTTKGDNNRSIDPTGVTTEAIYGKVLFKLPKIGYIQNFLSKPSNFFLAIIIPALIVFIYDGYKIMLNMKKKHSY